MPRSASRKLSGTACPLYDILQTGKERVHLVGSARILPRAEECLQRVENELTRSKLRGTRTAKSKELAPLLTVLSPQGARY